VGDLGWADDAPWGGRRWGDGAEGGVTGEAPPSNERHWEEV